MLQPVGDDPSQRIPFGGGGEDAIAPVDGPHVVRSRADGVGGRDVDVALGVELHARRRIIHHRRALVRRRDVVVLQAECVADLVRAHLPHARQNEGGVGGGGVCAHQTRIQIVIRARAVRVHARHPFDDLAGARIAERAADRPAALVAVLPLDDVVARVHRIDAVRQELGDESALEASAVERFLPPLHTLQGRGANRLRDAPVDVIANRLLDRRRRIVRVHSLEPMPRRPTDLQRTLDGLCVIFERDAEVSDARIELTRAVARIRQLEQRDVLPQGERSAIGNDRLDDAAGATGRRECELAVDLGVLRKGARIRPIDARAVARECVRPLLAAGQRAGDVVPVAERELGGVYKKTAPLLSDQR